MYENRLSVENHSIDTTELLQEHQGHDDGEGLPVDVHGQHGLERDGPDGLLPGETLLHDLQLLGRVVMLPAEPLQGFLGLILFTLGQEVGRRIRHEEHQ